MHGKRFIINSEQMKYFVFENPVRVYIAKRNEIDALVKLQKFECNFFKNSRIFSPRDRVEPC